MTRQQWAMVIVLGAFCICQLPFQKVLFVDEPDNMQSGWSIAQGEVPYRDFFSHHAPFPYLYSAVFHLLAGKNFVFQRYSVSCFGLVALLALVRRFWSSGDSTFRVAAILFVGLWTLYSRIYWHFLILADNYVGYSLLAVVAVLLHALWTGEPLTGTDRVALGWFTFAGIGSNPHALFPLAGCALFYGLVEFRSGGRLWTKFGLTALSVLTPSLMAAAYFGWHRSLGLMWNNVVVFNAKIYSQFLGDTTNFFGPMGQAAVTAFELIELNKWDFAPHLFESIQYWGDDRWFCLGFVGRLCILGFSLVCLWQRKLLLAAFVIVVAITSLSRDLSFHGPTEFAWWFHIQHFRVLCLLCMCLLAALALESIRTARGIQRIGSAACLLGLISVNLLVAIRGIHAVAEDGMRLTWSRTAAIEKWDGFLGWQTDMCTALAGEKGYVSSFPNGDYVNYLGKYSPASYFRFYLPWTAVRPGDVERLRSDIEHGTGKSTAFWIHRDGEVWGIPLKRYSAPVLQLLDDNYIRIAQDVHVSEGSQVMHVIDQAIARGEVHRSRIPLTRIQWSMPDSNPLKTATLQTEDFPTSRVVELELQLRSSTARSIDFRFRLERDSMRWEQTLAFTSGSRNRRLMLWLPQGISSIDVAPVTQDSTVDWNIEKVSLIVLAAEPLSSSTAGHAGADATETTWQPATLSFQALHRRLQTFWPAPDEVGQ